MTVANLAVFERNAADTIRHFEITQWNIRGVERLADHKWNANHRYHVIRHAFSEIEHPTSYDRITQCNIPTDYCLNNNKSHFTPKAHGGEVFSRGFEKSDPCNINDLRLEKWHRLCCKCATNVSQFVPYCNTK